MKYQGGFEYQKILAILFGLAFSISASAFAADDDGMYDLDGGVGHFTDYQTADYGSGHSFNFETPVAKKTKIAQAHKPRDPKSTGVDIAQEEEVQELTRNEVAWYKGPAAADPTPTPTESEGFKIRLNRKK